METRHARGGRASIRTVRSHEAGPRGPPPRLSVPLNGVAALLSANREQQRGTHRIRVGHHLRRVQAYACLLAGMLLREPDWRDRNGQS